MTSGDGSQITTGRESSLVSDTTVDLQLTENQTVTTLMPASCAEQKPDIDGVYRKIGDIAASKSNPFVNINDDDDEIQLDNFSFIEALKTCSTSPKKELSVTRCSVPLDSMQLALTSDRLRFLLVNDQFGSDWATTAPSDDLEERHDFSPRPEARNNPELMFHTSQVVDRQRKRRRRNTILGPPASVLQNVGKNNFETRLPCLDSFYSCSSYYSDIDGPEKAPRGMSQNYIAQRLANPSWQEVFGDSNHTRLEFCERPSKVSSCTSEDPFNYDAVELSAADVETIQRETSKASCVVRAGSSPAPNTVLSLQRGQSVMIHPCSSFYNLAALDST
jgi:hypothetical protein